jgi:outer membrane protein assembly factor BamB
MLGVLAVGFVGVALVLAALYQFAGVRPGFDGTGLMPRFASTGPDYEALEADRARQRAGAPPVERVESAASLRSTPSAPDPAATAPPPASPLPRAEPSTPASVDPRRTAAAWTDFRGPNRDGKYAGSPIRTEWPRDGLPLIWKHPIGPGYASFVVADGRAFTIEQRRRQEVIAAYDLATGRELWTNAWDAEFVETMGGPGPRATPTVHGGVVYALGAAGELRALDAGSGVARWRRNILTENSAPNLDWGMSGAPLIVDHAVVVLPGGSRGRSVVAYDKTTGDELWHSLDDRQAYTSPMLVTLGGLRQITFVSATRVVGLAAENGRLLWEYPWPTSQGINAAQPLMLGNDRVFVSSGYGQGAAVFEVTRDGERFATRTVWQNMRMKNKFTSPLLHDGHIYGLDEAILACVDAATGELKWKGGRYGYGQVMLAGDRLIVLTEDGEVVQVRATPTRHEEVASFPAIEGKTWNHPVIADGRLLVRNVREMAAFDISLPP